MVVREENAKDVLQPYSAQQDSAWEYSASTGCSIGILLYVFTTKGLAA
jgi:hypothetical protein